MNLTNKQIYEHATNLAQLNIDIKLPVRINFFLQKNIQTIRTSAEEIEKARFEIGAQFGTLNETQTGYDIPADKVQEAHKELSDLFNLEQDLPIHIFKLDDFDGIELTYQQMSAIMFMIEE